MAHRSICILPQLKTTGGPSSFQLKLKAGLAVKGIETHHDISRKDTSALLITGATRDIAAILEARQRGIRIVQRLDGMNWLHKQRATGIRHYLRSERMNLQLALIRRMFADAIIYQSKFTQDWWNRVYGQTKKPSTVVYNAVDLAIFNPSRSSSIPKDFFKILVVEGSFKGGHERDLLNAMEFANCLAESLEKKVELTIAGDVPANIINGSPINGLTKVNYLGILPHSQIPELDRSAHLFFPAEINAACPNSVIEALACGLPVVGYNTGSIPELVGEDGGTVVPYGSDYWKLQPPHTNNLVNSAKIILKDLAHYRDSARKRAEKLFSLSVMVDRYQEILLND